MKDTQPHWMAEHVSCDQLAECYEGVSQELYRRLYEALQNVKETAEINEALGIQHGDDQF